MYFLIFSFLYFFINPPRSAATQWMVIKCIPETKASLVDLEISPTPPLIFTGGGVKNCQIWRSFQHHLTMSRPRLKIQQGIRTLKQNCNATMIALCPRQVGEVQVGSTHPWEPFGKSTPRPKIARRKRAKSSITQPWIILFRSNFIQSLNAWHPKCCKKDQVKKSKVKVTAWHNV